MLRKLNIFINRSLLGNSANCLTCLELYAYILRLSNFLHKNASAKADAYSYFAQVTAYSCKLLSIKSLKAGATCAKYSGSSTTTLAWLIHHSIPRSFLAGKINFPSFSPSLLWS